MFLRQTLFSTIYLFAQTNEVESAAVLFGAVRSSSAGGSLTLARMRQQLQDRLNGALGAGRFEELAATGEALPIERASRLAEDALAARIEDGYQAAAPLI